MAVFDQVEILGIARRHRHRWQIIDFCLFGEQLTNAGTNQLRRNFFEQILFGFVDFIAFCAGSGADLFIQFVNVGDVNIWYLLHYL